MEPARVQEGVAALDSELRFILEDKGINEETMAKIGLARITRINVFANIESQEDRLRDWIKEDLGIEGRGEGRVTTAQLIDAWETARKRVRTQQDAEAEARTQGRPRELLLGQQLELRKTFEKMVGEVKDKLYPAYTSINTKLSEIEEGELRAEPLDEIVPREREDADSGDLKVDFTRGTIKLKKTIIKGHMPRNAEELRTIYRLMSNLWLVLRCKLPGRKLFDGLSKETFADLLDHLLGEHILELNVEDDNGNTLAQTSWKNMLRYEFELRKMAIKLVNREGETLHNALKRASMDGELRTRYIVTTLALEGSRTSTKRPFQQLDPPQPTEPANNRNRNPKGKGRGKDKGAGKGKKGNNNKGGNAGARDDTCRFNRARREGRVKNMTEGENPQRICWNFQRAQGCRGGCNFAHVCALCLGNHSIKDCPVYDARR